MVLATLSACWLTRAVVFVRTGAGAAFGCGRACGRGWLVSGCSGVAMRGAAFGSGPTAGTGRRSTAATLGGVAEVVRSTGRAGSPVHLVGGFDAVAVSRVVPAATCAGV